MQLCSSRKLGYRRYDQVTLERAVQAVESGHMTQHKAAIMFGVPQRTICYRLSKEKRKKTG